MGGAILICIKIYTQSTMVVCDVHITFSNKGLNRCTRFDEISQKFISGRHESIKRNDKQIRLFMALFVHAVQSDSYRFV